MRLLSLCLLSLFVTLPTLALADIQTDGTKPDAEETAPSDVITYPPLKQHEFKPLYIGNTPIGPFVVTGYIAGSYNYLNRSNMFTSEVNDRLFDLQENGYTLQQSLLNIAAEPDLGFGGVLSLLMGRDAHTTAPYGMDPIFEHSEDLALDPYQGYLQYSFSKFSVMAGRFYAYSGYEYDYTAFNPNFSSSLISTYMQPSTLTGIRGTYKWSDELEFYASVNDGWDTVRDWSRRKTVELGTQFSRDAYVLQAYLYNGQERVTDSVSSGPTGIRTLLDLIATYKMNDKLTLAGNFDYYNQSKGELANGELNRAIEHGLAGYVNYQWTDKWRTSVRAEYYDDENGFGTGVNQVMKEATITIGYLMFKQFELRGEARHDFSNNLAFLNRDQETTSNNMQSFALEGILTL